MPRMWPTPQLGFPRPDVSLASDAHNMAARMPELEPGRAAAEEIVGEAECWRLVRERPAAIAATNAGFARSGNPFVAWAWRPPRAPSSQVKPQMPVLSGTTNAAIQREGFRRQIPRQWKFFGPRPQQDLRQIDNAS